MKRPIVWHIPVCPFSQRLEILLALKDRRDAVDFRVVDITRPRDPALLEKTGGSSVLPVLEPPEGGVLSESLVLLRYLDEAAGGPAIRRTDVYEHAVENMLITIENPMGNAGYAFVMNRDPLARARHEEALLQEYRRINALLLRHGGDGPWLFDRFGLAETVFVSLFMRFWFLDYYEAFRLPDGPDYARFAVWRDACMAHPAAQQVCEEEIVKLYYDYAQGMGNGALPPGRQVSSFVFTPDWRDRPWPPRDKWAPATDSELGLSGAAAGSAPSAR